MKTAREILLDQRNGEDRPITAALHPEGWIFKMILKAMKEYAAQQLKEKDLYRFKSGVKEKIGGATIGIILEFMEPVISTSQQKPELSDAWISVKDRLPDEPCAGETIPVLATEGSDKPVFECAYEGKGEFCSSMFSHYLDATHWMPLPKPPNQ